MTRSLLFSMVARLPLLLLGATALACTAAAQDEVEPNNVASSATAVAINDTARGSLTSGDVDFWELDFPSPVLLTVELDSYTDPVFFDFWAANESEVLYAVVHLSASHRTYRLIIDPPEVYRIRARADSVVPNYTATFSVSANFSAIAGPSEVEPNNHLESATPFELNETVSGFLDDEFVDEDWWVIDMADRAWLRIEVNADYGAPPVEAIWESSILHNHARSGSGFLLYEVRWAAPVYLHLPFVRNTGIGYTIHVSSANTSLGFWAGPDETEPNNDRLTADEAAPNTTFEGLIDSLNDDEDHIKISVGPWALVEVNVTFHSRSSNFFVIHSLGQSAGEPKLIGGETRFSFRKLVVQAGTVEFYLHVEPVEADVSYTINTSLRPLGLHAGGIVTIAQLNEAVTPDLKVRPKNSPPTGGSAPATYTLVNGDGFMFGETMCASIAILDGEAQVYIPAGQHFAPINESLQYMTSSRNQTITLRGSEPACFRAMSVNEEGVVGSPSDLYEVRGPIVGDAAAIMWQISDSERDLAPGQLALWSATSHTNETRAREWGATGAAIAEARDILADAGVQTPLSAPNAPQGITALFQGLMLLIVGLVAVGVLVAVVVLVALSRRQKG